GGAFSAHGIETVAPFLCRGVLIDVARALGVDTLEPGQPVTAADLERAADVELRPGDAVLVRTGWAPNWDDAELFGGAGPGAPGPDVDGARWLAERGPRLVGSDTVAFEHVPPGRGHALLPVHSLLLVEHGIHIVEMLMLEELAADGVREFAFVAAPLKLVG